MSEQVNQPDPAFGVEIRSGRRAVAAGTQQADPRQDRAVPAGTGAARKERNRNLALAAAALFFLFVGGLVGWQWWTTRVPAGVLARVNGEEIRVEQVDREILVSRMLGVLITGAEPVPAPSRSSMLATLIQRRMKAQDAENAGLRVSDEDMNLDVQSMLQRNELSEDELAKALAGYGLTRSDLYNTMRDYVLINRYIAEYVTKGAGSTDARSQRINDWETQLNRTSRIETFAISDAPRIGTAAADFKLPILLSPGAPEPEPGKAPVEGVDFVSLAGLHGRPVIINFWATWCQPCRVELPELQQAYQQYKESMPGPGPGLEVLGVLVDSDPNTAAAFQKEYGITFPVLIDEGSQVKDLYRVGPIPTSFFIDRQGIVRYVKVGMVDQKELADKIKLIQ